MTDAQQLRVIAAARGFSVGLRYLADRIRVCRQPLNVWIAVGCGVYQIGHVNYFLGDSSAKSVGLLLAATVAFKSLCEL